MSRLGWTVALALSACDGDKVDRGSGDADADIDIDTDVDTDTDTDTLGPDADQDGSPDDEDCDDADPAVYPGAPDLCGDDRVTDCDRESDDGLVTLDGAQGFDDLQAALDAAAEGSELLLCPGTYTGSFEAAVPVRLVAREDATTTTVSGSGGPALAVPGGSEVVGLTIRDGRGVSGGGLAMTSAGTLQVEGCVITANHADYGGGLLVAPNGVATLVDTEVTANSADEGGGGVKVGAGGTLDLTAGSSVSGNAGGWFGGGVWLEDAHQIGGTVSGNVLTEDIYVYLYGGELFLYHEGFGGAGVAMTGLSDATGTEVSGNTGLGGGVSVTSGTGTLIDVAVHDNTAGVWIRPTSPHPSPLHPGEGAVRSSSPRLSAHASVLSGLPQRGAAAPITASIRPCPRSSVRPLRNSALLCALERQPHPSPRAVSHARRQPLLCALRESLCALCDSSDPTESSRASRPFAHTPPGEGGP